MWYIGFCERPSANGCWKIFGWDGFDHYVKTDLWPTRHDYHISVFTSWFGDTMTEIIYWSSFWTLRGAPNSWKTRHFHTEALSRKQATCQNTSMSGSLSTFYLLFSIICVFWNLFVFLIPAAGETQCVVEFYCKVRRKVEISLLNRVFIAQCSENPTNEYKHLQKCFLKENVLS